MENRKSKVEGVYLLPKKVMLTVFFSHLRKNLRSTILSFVEMMTVVQQAMFLVFHSL